MLIRASPCLNSHTLNNPSEKRHNIYIWLDDSRRTFVQMREAYHGCLRGCVRTTAGQQLVAKCLSPQKIKRLIHLFLQHLTPSPFPL